MEFSLTRLIFSIVFTLSAGAIGSIATSSAIPSWYSTLNQPWFNPPNWIFAPVWTFLYLLMGISFYLIWQTKTKRSKRGVITLFIVQLVLNTLWSLIFFGLRQPALAMFEIIILWIFIYLSFLQIRRVWIELGLLTEPLLTCSREC